MGRGRSGPMRPPTGSATRAPGQRVLSSPGERSPPSTLPDRGRAGRPGRRRGVRACLRPRGHLDLTVGSTQGREPHRSFSTGTGRSSWAASELPIATAAATDEGMWTPGSPLVAEDRTAFVSGDPGPGVNAPVSTTVFALDPSGRVMRGWPRIRCWPPVGEGWLDAVASALWPGKVVYSLRAAPDAGSSVEPTTGGSIVATGPDGRVRLVALVLSRPRAEIRSAVVGPDGTVYAVAIENEPDHPGSATILAIGPMAPSDPHHGGDSSQLLPHPSTDLNQRRRRRSSREQRKTRGDGSGRGLTCEELERMLRRYPRDMPERREPDRAPCSHTARRHAERPWRARAGCRGVIGDDQDRHSGPCQPSHRRLNRSTSGGDR